MTEDISSAPWGETERASCKGVPPGPFSPLRQATQLETSNILQSKHVLTWVLGSNPEVWAISLEWILQGLNIDGTHRPWKKTLEQVWVQTFPDLLSTLTTLSGLPRSECSLVLLSETGTLSASHPGIGETWFPLWGPLASLPLQSLQRPEGLWPGRMEEGGTETPVSCGKTFKVFPLVWVDGDVKVSVQQVYRRHPFLWNQRGLDGLWSFHFELFYK